MLDPQMATLCPLTSCAVCTSAVNQIFQAEANQVVGVSGVSVR